MLRNAALIAYTLVLLSVNTLGGFLGISQAQASSISKNNVIALTNVERQKYGLPVLTENSRLNSAALAKANNMFKEQYWDHFGPNGETPWQFIKGAGYQYIYAGENLAKGFKSSEGVVQAWMASPTHRENILSGNYKEVGIATLDGVLLGENVTLVVQMFGNTTSATSPAVPVSPPPVVEEPIEKGEIKSIKITYPTENSVVTDPSFTVKGEVTNVNKDEYSVEISDGEKVVGKLSTNGTLWDFTRNSDWAEGDHKITATMPDEDAEVKDSASFKVDSTPPRIEDEDIVINELSGDWIVDVTTVENNPDITLVIGSKVFPSTFIEGIYRITVDSVGTTDKVVLIASDEYGNTLELEITDRFETGEGDVLGGFLNSVNIKDTVNTVFVIFIFILLLIEITVYVRKGMVKEKRGSLFSLSMWWLLLLVGTLNGFGGAII